VIFSDGTVLEQLVAGIVRSGSMITISGNSRMQVILKVMFCIWAVGAYVDSAHRIMAIGDDTLERLHGVPPEYYQRWLTTQGFTCHEISIGPMIDRVFCSHAFKRHGQRVVPLPTNWKKHCYALCRKEKSKLQFFPEQLFSLMLEYCFDDEHFRQLRAVCASIKPEYCHSQQRFQNFVLGLESDLPLPVISESAAQVLRGDECSSALMSIVAKGDAKLFQPRLEGVEENPGPVELEFLAGAMSFVLFWTSMVLFTTLQHPAGRRHETKVWLVPVLVVGILLTARASAQSIREELFSLDYNPPPSKELPVVFNVLKPIKDIFNNSVSRSVGKTVLDFFGTPRPPVKRHEPQRETVTVMPPKPKGKSGQKKMQHQKAKRKAAITTIKETVVVKTAAGKRRTHNGGGRLAFLRANRFNMDTARFGGRDLVAKIVLSANAASQTSGADKAGTCLWQCQLRPQVFIPNTRLSRLMGLFMKWKLLKARFTFKSSLPPATNAGTMLFVHEPDPNEVIPAQFAAPTGGTLSNYDSHSIKALVPMAKIPDDFKGERNDHLDLQPSKAVGPGGGWFLLDPENAATAFENSMGQFAIFVQDAHNILGSNSSLPTLPYEIGSLFFEYDIEVQTAADNDSQASGYTEMAVITSSTSRALVSYSNPGSTASTTFSVTGGNKVMLAQNANTNWQIEPSNGQNGIQMNVQWDGTNEWWQFPDAGVYLLMIAYSITTAADAGAAAVHPLSGASFKTGLGSTASVLLNVHNDCTATSLGGSGVCMLGAVVSVTDPEVDFLTFGTTNFQTPLPTTKPFVSLRIISLPNSAIKFFQNMIRQQRAEEKKIDAIKPHIQAMFREWLSSADPSWQSAAPETLGGKAEVKDVASPEASGLGLESATVKPAVPQDAEPTVRRVGTDSWVKVGRSDDESGLDDREKLSLRSQRGPERPQALGLREGFERYLAALAGGERSSGTTSALAPATTR